MQLVSLSRTKGLKKSDIMPARQEIDYYAGYDQRGSEPQRQA